MAYGGADSRWWVQSPTLRLLTVAGLVLLRKRPGSAKGVVFVTLEDETVIANVIVWPKLYERQRRVLLGARLLEVRGRVRREGAVVHLIAQSLTDLSAELDGVGSAARRAPERTARPPGGQGAPKGGLGVRPKRFPMRQKRRIVNIFSA